MSLLFLQHGDIPKNDFVFRINFQKYTKKSFF